MADDNDKENDKNTKKLLRETCIGIWTRGKTGEKDTINWICNGISVVRVDKDVNKSIIKPSETRGLQIIIQELDDNKNADNGKYNDPESKRDPQRHVFPPEDPDLGRRLVNILRKKSERLEERVHGYVHDGVSVKDAWNGLTDMMMSCYQTTTRILSYCKPKEKLDQVYNFVSTRVKDVGSNWRSNGDDKGNKK